jgi:hypothetical protein
MRPALFAVPSSDRTAPRDSLYGDDPRELSVLVQVAIGDLVLAFTK